MAMFNSYVKLPEGKCILQENGSLRTLDKKRDGSPNVDSSESKKFGAMTWGLRCLQGWWLPLCLKPRWLGAMLDHVGSLMKIMGYSPHQLRAPGLKLVQQIRLRTRLRQHDTSRISAYPLVN